MRSASAPLASGLKTANETATATAKTAAVGAEGLCVMPEGTFLVASRPARADETCYTPPLLAHREGDRMVALCVSVPLGPRYLRLTQTYLVGTGGEKARRVLVRESLATGIEAELAAGDRGALQKEL